MAEPRMHHRIPLPRPRPAVVVAVALAMAMLFGALAADLVLRGPVTRLDVPISAWFGAHPRPWITDLMVALSAAHGTVAILVYAAVIGLVLAATGRAQWLPALVLTVPGGLLLNGVAKLGFHRARPVFDHPLVHLGSYSFPSGHAAGSTVLWGFLLVLWRAREGRPAARAAGAAVAATMVGLTCLSRVYLGAHYPSDVLAGIAEGTLWLLLCFSVVRAFTRRWPGVIA